MAQPCSREAGFSLLEALVGIAISAAVLGLVIEVLAGDVVQTRRFLNRSEVAVAQAQGQRAFMAAAAPRRGSGTRQAAGAMRIEPGRLVLITGQGTQTLWRWQRGEAALDYSEDGKVWRPYSADLAADSVRFSWRDGALEHVWIAP
jgi:type II secretory pathway pseudopilin PulG